MATADTAATATQAVQANEATILWHENDLVESNIAKLYLKERWSDVTFIFYTDQGDGKVPERIHAHKAILAAGSDVFDAMFFGPLKENAEVKIVDATAVAFKEFLQFFYRRKMQLTMDNVGEVVNLCRKYQVDDALTACEHRIKEKLNIANMCWGHAFSKNVDFPELRRFCEGEIQRNTLGILQTASFLDSERDDIVDILKLLSFEKHSIEIVNAYMNWARAECVRDNLEPNGINLRVRLGDDLIKMIPFNRISMEQFAQHTKACDGFFTANEFEMIMQEIEKRSEVRNQYGAVIVCDRRTERASLISPDITPILKSSTFIYAGKTVFLSEFHSLLIRSCSCDTDLVINYLIYNCGGLSGNEGIVLMDKTTLARYINELHIVLPKPILIPKGKCFIIKIEIEKCCGKRLTFFHSLKKKVRINDRDIDGPSGSRSGGIEIEFGNNPTGFDCITQLKFNRLKDD